MNKKLKQKLTTLTILLITFIVPISFSLFNFNLGGPMARVDSTTDSDDMVENPMNFEGLELKTSDVYHVGDKYDLSIWWNKTYRYRIGFVLEETEGIDRYQPMDVYFTFRANEHHQNTERLVSFNATGNDEWSDPIPMQMWNTTGTGDFIDSCTITFIANVSANTNKTYFLYYNESDEGIEQISYNTNFSSDYSLGTLTVTVGTEYQAVLETGLASTQLIRQGLDFHLDDSLSPEKELSDPRLKFLAHFENSYSDSTGNELDGIPTGGPSFTNGKVRSGIEFDGTNFVSYTNGLQDIDDPFDDGSTEFTLTAWVKPDVLTNARSNHYTQNVFAAKASDSINDNFEIGINSGSISGQLRGTVHVYLDCTGSGADTYTDFGNEDDIIVGAWNFIAVRFNADTGTVDVRINDNWYYNTLKWSGATDLDQAEGSPFTIGATEHTNTYFDGVVDEVAVYNEYLDEDDIEDFKLGSMPSTIQSISTINELENGEVFSRYKIDWTPAFDMYTSDICTFYYDYNLWSIKRSIYFENEFNYTTDSMFALNTNYDFSIVDEHTDLLYLYDGNLQKDITTAGFLAENYTIVHNAPDSSKDAVGMFIESFGVSDTNHMNISYFKGDVLYDNGIVQFLSGSINDLDNSVGNSSYKLIVDFWELAGSVNTSGNLDNAGMINYFDNMLLTLRVDANVYIYEQDSFFYNLDVNVTDIDNNLVPEATITVYNASDYGISWSQDTDQNGRTIFNRLEGGVYVVNVSYTKNSKTLTVTTPQQIELNETEVDTYGVYYLEFTNIQMTSLNLTINRVNNLGEFQEYLEGAEVSFYIDSGSGKEFISAEYADAVGNVVFRWQNFTKPSDGNVTFSIKWFVATPTNVTALGDLDGEVVGNTNVTFYFHVGNSSVVNCVFGNTFVSNLEFTVYPDPDFNKMLGEILYFQVNFTYIQDGTLINPVEGATVSYNVKLGISNVNTQNLYFTEIGGGLYNLTIDTSNPVELGGADWFSENDYLIEVDAFRPGFISGEISTSFILDPRSSSLVSSETELTAYWGEMLTVDVVYTDISFGGNNPIDSADVDFSVIGVPTLVGSLNPTGSPGSYRFELISSQFPTSDSYTLQITANKQNYQEKSLFIDINVLAIRTLINDSVGIYKTANLPFRETSIYYFTYIEESSSSGLAGSELRTFEWTKEVSGSVVDSGAGFLNDLGNGLYSLDFDTSSKEIAIYTIIFNIEKENYAQRGGIIILNIIPREIDPSIQTGYIIQTVSGNDLTISLDLNDKINSSAIVGADVSITLQGQTFDFDDEGDGTYTITIPASSLPNAFFLSETISATITVDNQYYYSEEIDGSIVVNLVEIFPGFPMFYFLMIVGAAVAVVGSLVAYRTIQKARIPTFVKKVREMSKNIKGRKSISDSLLYPSKEEYIVKELGEKWEMLGLSLDDILGIERKKGKKMPEIPESEGGNI